MSRLAKFLTVFVAILTVSGTAQAQDARMTERSVGKATAPIKVEEYFSLTCSHCAEFYNSVLPEIEKRYVETGKVRLVAHDFPIDAIGLKAAAIARCMPEDQYFPFVKILFKNLTSWALNGNPEANLIQYAKLGGLAEDKAKACANDAKLQDAIIADRNAASAKHQIDATPTFIINDGVSVVKGAQTIDTFAAAFDKVLAGKK